MHTTASGGEEACVVSRAVGGAHVFEGPARRPSPMPRALALFGSIAFLAALLPAAVAPVRAAEDPAGAAASGFLYYKYPTPDPGCAGLGLNVSQGPFFTPEDCGFAVFGITGAGSGAAVTVALFG